MSINGVLIFAGTSLYNYDAFFPKVSANNTQSVTRITPDFCLGTTEKLQTYRYYMFSPCIYKTEARTYASPCSNLKYPLCG
jgi:hypothetical protein